MNQECYITCEGGTERKPAFKIKTLQMLVLQFVAANGKFWTLTQQGVVINMFMLNIYAELNSYQFSLLIRTS